LRPGFDPGVVASGPDQGAVVGGVVVAGLVVVDGGDVDGTVQGGSPAFRVQPDGWVTATLGPSTGGWTTAGYSPNSSAEGGQRI
jgi:hypothetical protein